MHFSNIILIRGHACSYYYKGATKKKQIKTKKVSFLLVYSKKSLSLV